jgi:twitching motility protein PilI
MGIKMSLEPQNSSQIIQLLLQMETLSRNHAAPLPLEDEIKSMRSGIGFRIAEHHFVAPMEYVREIMKYPSISLVPGSKSWVKGIANIRGNLLPIFDLHGFLGKVSTLVKRETRILSISNEKLTTGLMVDEVYGMKYFDHDNFDAQMGYDVQWKEYLNGGYELEGKNWVVFDLQRLTENSQFLSVAV